VSIRKPPDPGPQGAPFAVLSPEPMTCPASFRDEAYTWPRSVTLKMGSARATEEIMVSSAKAVRVPIE
jgi:hypothetical protein